jgi:hypothetical protein
VVTVLLPRDGGSGVDCDGWDVTRCLMRADCRVGLSYAAPCRGVGGVWGVEVIWQGGVVAILADVGTAFGVIEPWQLLVFPEQFYCISASASQVTPPESDQKAERVFHAKQQQT